MTKKYLITVGTFGFLSIVFGAVMSQVLSGKLTAEHQSQYSVGIQFMMFHTMALLGFAFAHKIVSQRYLDVVYGFFVAGIILFSFGMMIQATSEWTDLSLGFMSFIIPLGVLSFLIGWGYIAWMGLSGKYKRSSSHSKSSSRRRRSSHSKIEDDNSYDF